MNIRPRPKSARRTVPFAVMSTTNVTKVRCCWQEGEELRILNPDEAQQAKVWTSETRSNRNPARTAARPRNHRRCIEVYVDFCSEGKYGGEWDVRGEDRQGGTAARMKVVSVRTDNGGEYVNEQFNAFLDKHDIRWNHPLPTNTRKTALLEGSGAARHSARILYGCTRILCGCTEL
jgi:hypothetical protein